MMKLFAPMPQRLVNIASLIEAYAKDAKDATDAAAREVCATCLRWSSLTFGIKELRIQYAVDAEIARFARYVCVCGNNNQSSKSWLRWYLS